MSSDDADRSSGRPFGGRPAPGLHQLLVESVRDYAIFALDPDGRVVSWNPGAERFNGYRAEEIIGKHFSAFYPAADVAAGKPRDELVIAAAEGRYEEEGWRVRKDGTRFWASVTITALRDERDRLVGFAKVTRDLTERREAQERAIEDARRLARIDASNRAKAEFLTALSHELRTPLNAIGGFTELMSMGLGGPVSEEQLLYLDRIRASQQHLLAIISDLLNFSRIEAGQISYTIRPVPVADSLDSVVAMLEQQARAKALRLNRLASCDGAIVIADRVKLEQILLNVIGNAVKFTPAGGSVTISCREAERSLLVAVADSGSGIPGGKEEEIFEPFVQLGRTLTSAQEGTGLGLAISRDLARAMGGELELERSSSEGSVFVLELPLEE